MYRAFLAHLTSQPPVVLLSTLAQVHLLYAGLSQVLNAHAVSNDPTEKRAKSELVARVLAVKSVF